jgi:cytochrome c oxidase subunit 1
LHYPHLQDRLQVEAHAGKGHGHYASELADDTGKRQGDNDPDPF